MRFVPHWVKQVVRRLVARKLPTLSDEFAACIEREPNIARYLNRLAQTADLATLADAVDPALIDAISREPKLAINLGILANDLGQAQSMRQGRPVAADGSPIPWFTYPAVEYLSQWDFTGKQVFEYGSGFSTIYWSRCGAQVASVDHNRQWLDEVAGFGLEGVELMHHTERDAYADAIKGSGRLFDVVVVDGVWREDCVRACIPHVAPSGFVILDNADWYWRAGNYLREQGFLEVSFSGFAPINHYVSTTSLFFPGRQTPQANFQVPRPKGGRPLSAEEESDPMF